MIKGPLLKMPAGLVSADDGLGLCHRQAQDAVGSGLVQGMRVVSLAIVALEVVAQKGMGDLRSVLA